MFSGKPNSVRLYSIASSRYGDDMTGNTATLCVRRATYWCPDLGAEDPAKKGVCSNYLCDATPGTECKMTGPSGKVMLMPEDKPETDIIMVATGTGIAPYRSFWKRLFIEETPAGEAYKGLAWLFLGVANSDALLYDEELQSIKTKYPDNFRLDYALSREATNKKGGKMYIQDKVRRRHSSRSPTSVTTHALLARSCSLTQPLRGSPTHKGRRVLRRDLRPPR